MSNFEPKEAYVYQPDPPFKPDGSRNERIYGISGTMADHDYFSGRRFTKEEAEKELARYKELTALRAVAEAGEKCLNQLQFSHGNEKINLKNALAAWREVKK